MAHWDGFMLFTMQYSICELLEESQNEAAKETYKNSETNLNG